MNATSQLQYYVYGLGSNDASVFHIGVTDQNPDTKKQEIYSSLAGNEIIQLNKSTGEGKTDADLDLFEIEAFPSVDAAQEAVAFWIGYFQSLGLSMRRISSQTGFK